MFFIESDKYLYSIYHLPTISMALPDVLDTRCGCLNCDPITMALADVLDENGRCLHCNDITAMKIRCKTCGFDHCFHCAIPCIRHVITSGPGMLSTGTCPNSKCGQKCSACSVALCLQCLREQSPLYGNVFVCSACAVMCIQCDRVFACKPKDRRGRTVCDDCLKLQL